MILKNIRFVHAVTAGQGKMLPSFVDSDGYEAVALEFPWIGIRRVGAKEFARITTVFNIVDRAPTAADYGNAVRAMSHIELSQEMSELAELEKATRPTKSGK